jgi:hypothetical protein
MLCSSAEQFGQKRDAVPRSRLVVSFDDGGTPEAVKPDTGSLIVSKPSAATGAAQLQFAIP